MSLGDGISSALTGVALAGRTTPGAQVREEKPMPELLVDFITSLDGYGAADGWPGWWGLEGPEYLTWLGETPDADSTVLDGHEHLPRHVRIRRRW